MKFKVGDKVKIKKNGEIGYIYEVETTQIRKFDLDAKFYDLYYSYNVINGTRVYTLLDEEELELLEKSKEPSTLEELEERLEKLEKCVMGEQKSLEKRENEPIYERNERFSKILKEEIAKNSINLNDKKSLLSEDERVILRNLDKRYKWIIRDSDNNLYICINEPFKKENMFWNCKGGFDNLGLFNHLFDFIKWEYKEQKPYNIKELLEGND